MAWRSIKDTTNKHLDTCAERPPRPASFQRRSGPMLGQDMNEHHILTDNEPCSNGENT